MLNLRAFTLAVLGVCGVACGVGSQTYSFAGGSIPDGTSGTAGSFGAPLVRTVESNATNPIQDVVVSITMSHTWVGDLRVRLSYTPSGSATTTTAFLFNRVGAATTNSVGDGSDLAGTYTFVFAGTDMWDSAVSLGLTAALPSGVYQPLTNNLNGTHPNLELKDFFRGLPGTGTWTLTFEDGATSDLGTVTAASVTLTAQPLPCLADFNLDGVVNTADLTFFLGRFSQVCP
jgi:subtilisin-like proprotein convertase family protein